MCRNRFKQRIFLRPFLTNILSWVLILGTRTLRPEREHTRSWEMGNVGTRLASSPEVKINYTSNITLCSLKNNQFWNYEGNCFNYISTRGMNNCMCVYVCEYDWFTCVILVRRSSTGSFVCERERERGGRDYIINMDSEWELYNVIIGSSLFLWISERDVCRS